MDVREVRYNGHTANPSDYGCAEGDLALSLNMVNEDGALKPVLPGSCVLDLSEYGAEGVHIHRNGAPDYIHYITIKYDSSEGTLTYGWIDSTAVGEDGVPTAWTEIMELEGEQHTGITSLGNVLVITTDQSVHYVLWKQDDRKYVHLGTEVPRVRMEFALSGNVVQKWYSDLGFSLTDGTSTNDDAYTRILTTTVPPQVYTDFDVVLTKGTAYRARTPEARSKYYHTIILAIISESKHIKQVGDVRKSEWSYFTATADCTKISVYVNCEGHVKVDCMLYLEEAIGAVEDVPEQTEGSFTAMMGVMNAFVNDKATKKNRHIYPFFVRYAVRMYDGSYCQISPPILMRPNTGYAPVMTLVTDNTEDEGIDAGAFVADLQARVVEAIDENWEGIIGGVDLFFSQPIYCYEQGAEFSAEKFVFYDYAKMPDNYGFLQLEDSESDVYAMYKLEEYLGYKGGYTVVQIAPVEDTTKKLLEVSAFYKVKSYNFDEVNDLVTDVDAEGKFSTVELDGGVLSGLAAREALSDEMLAGRTLVSGNMTAYNNRLHVCNTTWRLPEPFGDCHGVFMPDAMVDYTSVYVRLITDEGERMVCHEIIASETCSLYFRFKYVVWFYYPDSRATDVYFVNKFSLGYAIHAHLELTAHEYLNGAYWCAELMEGQNIIDTIAETMWVSDTVVSPTTIYVSEANDPFVFSSASAVSIGCNKVYALSNAARALSVGQFGQFPLYAFTDTGVWALETADTGAYTARQPITRDVCVNAASVTQLDSEVMFATDRGIMLLSGSQTQCISDVLDSPGQFDVTVLPAFAKVLAVYNGTSEAAAMQLLSDDLALLPFKEFLASCRMVYDYVQQRIVVFNPSVRYAYVYSLKSKMWGMMYSEFLKGFTLMENVNGYPEAYVMSPGPRMIDLSVAGAEAVTGFVVTRPFTLGDPDGMKTVYALMQRGMFHKGNVGQVLYGSRDLYNWHLVKSSTNRSIRCIAGTPYKAFRLVLVFRCPSDESLYGCSVQYDRKLTNRIR